MIPRPLFGGAIELALPARFVDVSPFRQIPDHQEVFFDGPSDQSVIVEILSFVPQENARAAAYHFECVQAPIDRRLVCRHLPLTPFSSSLAQGHCRCQRCYRANGSLSTHRTDSRRYAAHRVRHFHPIVDSSGLLIRLRRRRRLVQSIILQVRASRSPSRLQVQGGSSKPGAHLSGPHSSASRTFLLVLLYARHIYVADARAHHANTGRYRHTGHTQPPSGRATHKLGRRCLQLDSPV